MEVLKGEHPPRGIEFDDGLWETLELCWEYQPDARPNIEDVLQYLESASQPPEPPSSEVSGGADEGVVSDSSNDLPGMLHRLVPSAKSHDLYPLRGHRGTGTHWVGFVSFRVLALHRPLYSSEVLGLRSRRSCWWVLMAHLLYSHFSDFQITGHWQHCPKYPTHAPGAVFHIETIKEDSFSPRQIVHHSRVPVQKERPHRALV